MSKIRAFAVLAILVIFALPIDVDARRFGGGFKFSSAKSYKAPSWTKSTKSSRFSGSTRQTNRSSQQQKAVGGSTNRSAAASSRSSARQTRFARTPTNHFSNTRQKNAYNRYQQNQRSKFQKTSNTSTNNANVASRPLYKNAADGANTNSRSYWNRRDRFYNNWDTPQYVYGGAPSYGMFDGLFLGYMLGNAMSPGYSRFAHSHRNDPGMQEWMKDMEAQANENAELRAQLDVLKNQMAQLEGTSIDPEYLPPGVDADMVLAPSVVATLKPSFRLCTASEEGNYYAFGSILQRKAALNVNVEVVKTAGSMENLQLLEKDQCDGAFVQRNAFTTYADQNPSGSFDFERIATPAQEYAHMVCNRASNVDDVGDLIGKTLLIDQKGSGTEVTWNDFVAMDDNYKKVNTQNVGGSRALNLVSTRQADCMLFVASLNTDLMQRANKLGDTVKLVPVNDWDFNDKKYGGGELFKGHQDQSGERIYVFTDLPGGQYDNIQDGILFSSVETLSVPVDMVASHGWRKKHSRAYDSLLGAVIDAQPEIDLATAKR